MVAAAACVVAAFVVNSGVVVGVEVASSVVAVVDVVGEVVVVGVVDVVGEVVVVGVVDAASVVSSLASTFS